MIKAFELLRILDDAHLPFMIIGGMAAVIHGASTTTQDLDISISRDSESLLKLRKCLKDIHPIHRMTPQRLSFLAYPESLEGLSNLYLRTDLGVLDVIGDLSLVGDFHDLFNRSEVHAVAGRNLHVISLADLIHLKRKLAREKDLLVVKELEVILKTRK